MSLQDLIGDIISVHKAFANQVSQFSEQALNNSQNAERWTAGQVTEHIIKSNGGILAQLLKGDAQPVTRPFNEHVELIKNIFRSEDLMKTASNLEPGNPPHNLEDLLKSLEKQKEQQLETIQQTNLNEISSELQFPPTPNGLTRYEWLVFMLEHAHRHLKQIKVIYKEMAR